VAIGAGIRTVPAVLTYNQMVVDKKLIREEEKATDLLFRALADPIRRGILRRAHEGRYSVSALAREHPISVTAMQKHVAVLERAELVSKHRVGRESIVRAQPDALVRARAALDRLEADWRGRIERMEQILESNKGDD
jgi:DNA-binding transcriptional ArsR family regulator